jgi:hypothetical protein
MKKFLLLTTLITSITISAQVGIGTTSPAATADITAINPTGGSTNVDGLLIPRVERSRARYMIGVITSTLIYVDNLNSSANGQAVNIDAVGFYHFDGAVWQKLNSGGSGSAWNLTGNTGTTPGTNFIGTTDVQNLQLRTNGNERLTISGANGNVAIGTPTISPTTRLVVYGGATGDGIYGHTGNVGGVLGREGNITLGVPVQTLSGSGVYANNPSAGYTSVYAQSTGAASVAANIAYSDVWMASYNYVQNGSNSYNPSSSYNQLNITNSALGGTQIALRGLNDRGTTNSNPGYTVGVQGVSLSRNQDSRAVEGVAYTNSNISVGGYFSGNNYTGTNYAYAYVGGTTNGAAARKITGTGSVSEIIPTENHGRVTLTCPESPEYWYQDYGTVHMVNGKATIILDDILADIIVVDEENPIRVICTPVGMPYFNGVTIIEQTNKSVEILELNGGNNSGKLQYQLVVKPKTNYGEGRFPQAPGPAYLKADKEPLAAKAKNQPNDGRKIFKWKSDEEVYNYNPEDHIATGDIVPAGPNAGKVFLGKGKYSIGMPAENPGKKRKAT